jgi:predicted enzyme related to lactoylglutathione lyase
MTPAAVESDRSHSSKTALRPRRSVHSMTTGALTFFELGVEDAAKGRAFYEALFGWTFETGPSGNGWVISTPGVPGGMHPGDKGAAPYVFFAVEDMDAALARVAALGGERVPFDGGDDDEASVARFGRFEFCKDDQGSPFGLHQPPA